MTTQDTPVPLAGTSLNWAMAELKRCLSLLGMGSQADRVQLRLLEGSANSEKPGPLGSPAILNDGFSISSNAESAEIAARSTRGLMYGIFALLEAMGCRWYFPGSEGERIPAPVRTLPTLSRVENPAFARRSLVQVCQPAHMEEIFDFAARMRYNRVYLHPSAKYLPVAGKLAAARGLEIGVKLHIIRALLPREHFRSHPEWFRFAGGARNGDFNLCVSSRAALVEVAANAQEMAGRLQVDVTDFSFWQDDARDAWCGCRSCRKLTASMQNLRLMEAILRGIRRVVPHARVAFLAYFDTTDGPQVPPGSIPEGIFLEFAPYPWCYSHAVDDPSCRRNVYLVRCLKENLERFGVGGAQIFEYWLDQSLFSSYQVPKRRMPFLFQRMAHDLRFYHRLGIQEIANVQFVGASGGRERFAQPGFALLPKLLWNPALALRSHLDDFCQRIGDGTKTRKLMELVEKADRENAMYSCMPSSGTQCCAKADALYRRAMKRMEGEDAGKLAAPWFQTELRRALAEDLSRQTGDPLGNPEWARAQDPHVAKFMIHASYRNDASGYRQSVWWANPACLKPAPFTDLVLRSPTGIAAHVGFFPFRLRTPFGQIKVVQAENVVTDPAYRGQGLMSRLFRMTQVELERAGAILAILWGPRLLYNRFGWEKAGMRHRFRIARSVVKGQDDADYAAVRQGNQVTETDARSIRRAYAARPFRVARGRDYFDWVLSRHFATTWVASSHEYFAYAVIMHFGGSLGDQVFEFGGDERGLKRILHEFFKEETRTALEVLAPNDGSGQLEFWRAISQDESQEPVGMIRVVSYVRLLEHYRPLLVRLAAAHGLQGVITLTVPERYATVSLRVGPRFEILDEPPVDGANEVALRDVDMVRLLFGPHDADLLAQISLSAIPAVKALFPLPFFFSPLDKVG